MTPIPAASPHRARLRTGLVLAGAAGAAIVAALLAQGRRPATPPAGPAERPAPPPRTATGLVVALPSTHLAAGPNETYLTAAITAPDATATARAPASIAIVIDRSGSMADDGKLAQAKAAAQALVDRLGPDDEATLISYDSRATVDVPLLAADGAGKAALRAAIAALAPGGNTGISAALWAGSDELARAHKDVRRIVLLSDGKPTDGVTNPADLIRFAGTRAETGVSISAIGMGLDYNEHVMAGIASAGRGNYYFVEQGTQLAAMFVKELDTLGQTVIAAGDLRIDAAPGVTIVDVLGYSFERLGPSAVRVPVADLRAKQQTKVVVRLRTTLAPTTAGYRAGAVDVATVQWRYRLVGGGAVEAVADARAIVTTDPTAVAAGRDATVVRMVEEVRTAEAIDQAAGEYADGRIERAQQILRARTTEAATAARELGDADLDAKVRQYAGAAAAGFAAPPPSAAAAKSGVKARRAEAYDLAR